MTFAALMLLAATTAALCVLVTSVRWIPDGQVGIVHRRFGNSPNDSFPIAVFGSAGPQAATLRANRMHFMPKFLYRIETVPRTHVPPNTIGVVIALAGEVPPPHQTLCRRVECNNFQDGWTFLLNGGQEGKQPAILRGGASYDINPRLFEVVTVGNIGSGRHDLTVEDLREVSIPEGTAGVVIALEGASPDNEDGAVGRRVDGHESFQYPWVFVASGGQRGVQSETLAPGSVYRINPWFARISLIPTRELILEWRRGAKPDTNFDKLLDEIVVNCEGHRVQIEVSQTIRILPQAAPRLVRLFGEQGKDLYGAHRAADPVPVQRFVDKVLGGTVEGYLHDVASQRRILELPASRPDLHKELVDRIRNALAEWQVDAVMTFLGEFRSTDPEIDRLLRRTVELEHRASSLLKEREIAEAEVAMERARRVLEETGLAERVRLVGRDAVALQLWLAELKNINVPRFVGTDVGLLLRHMPLPLPMATEMINQALGRVDRGRALPQPPRLSAELWPLPAPPRATEDPAAEDQVDEDRPAPHSTRYGASYKDLVNAQDWSGLKEYLRENRRQLIRVLKAMETNRSLGFRDPLAALRFLLAEQVVDESHVREIAAQAGIDARQLLPPANPDTHAAE